jgi:hypothetical protein
MGVRNRVSKNKMNRETKARAKVREEQMSLKIAVEALLNLRGN